MQRVPTTSVGGGAEAATEAAEWPVPRTSPHVQGETSEATPLTGHHSKGLLRLFNPNVEKVASALDAGDRGVLRQGTEAEISQHLGMAAQPGHREDHFAGMVRQLAMTYDKGAVNAVVNQLTNLGGQLTTHAVPMRQAVEAMRDTARVVGADLGANRVSDRLTGIADTMYVRLVSNGSTRYLTALRALKNKGYALQQYNDSRSTQAKADLEDLLAMRSSPSIPPCRC